VNRRLGRDATRRESTRGRSLPGSARPEEREAPFDRQDLSTIPAPRQPPHWSYRRIPPDTAGQGGRVGVTERARAWRGAANAERRLVAPTQPRRGCLSQSPSRNERLRASAPPRLRASAPLRLRGRAPRIAVITAGDHFDSATSGSSAAARRGQCGSGLCLNGCGARSSRRVRRTPCRGGGGRRVDTAVTRHCRLTVCALRNPYLRTLAMIPNTSVLHSRYSTLTLGRPSMKLGVHDLLVQPCRLGLRAHERSTRADRDPVSPEYPVQ
jgi:hypothetical protein